MCSPIEIPVFPLNLYAHLHVPSPQQSIHQSTQNEPIHSSTYSSAYPPIHQHVHQSIRIKGLYLSPAIDLSLIRRIYLSMSVFLSKLSLNNRCGGGGGQVRPNLFWHTWPRGSHWTLAFPTKPQHTIRPLTSPRQMTKELRLH